MSRIRLKTYFTILPIVLFTALISTGLSFFESRAALTKMANRLLTYKAEQLRDYINNEWNAVDSLNLSDDPEFRSAMEESFRSYAYSVLRSDTEIVFVFLADGSLSSRIGGIEAGLPIESRQHEILPEPLSPGWFSHEIFNEKRVGIAFEFPPFGWTVTITELRTKFFTEVDLILRNHLYILAGAALLALFLSVVHIRMILKPLEKLSGTIEQIIATDDLSIRFHINSQDEIGLLSTQFNGLVETVDTQRRELREANLAERRAHDTTHQRETETLSLLGRVSEYKDEKTGVHQNRIGRYSAEFLRLLDYDEEEVELLGASAPLHDIGKIAIPEAILLKPGKLTPEEWEIMKKHTLLGYELLRHCESQYLTVGAEIALTHHEHWDGRGYPQGLSGTDIPLTGRIVAIVDVYDALTSDRPYKSAWTRERTVDYILGQKESQFDPELIDIFRNNLDIFKSLDD